MTAHSDSTSKARPLLAVFLLLTVPLVLGAALAPYAFNGLRALGETSDILPKLTTARFEKVASRCVMIIALIMLYPVIKMTGLLPEVRRGLIGSRERYRDLGLGVFTGCFSIILIYLFGWMQNAYIISPEYTGLVKLTGRFTLSILGAVIIGFFEETFFRGIIFGAVRIRLGFITALIFSSMFFSGIHFFRPLFPEIITHASWDTGFAIIPHMFDKFVWPRDIYFALTLFIIGLTLATFYHKRGNLFLAIGLHGGWVLAQQTGSHVFDRQGDIMPVLFGHGDSVSKGSLALIVILLFLAAAIFNKPRQSSMQTGVLLSGKML
jgi:uncharacterized protein